MGQLSQESYWEGGGICSARRISSFPCRGCSPPILYNFVAASVLTDILTKYASHFNTFTAIVDLSRSNFSIARAPLFQLKSAT